jgi:hypothetical protein
MVLKPGNSMAPAEFHQIVIEQAVDATAFCAASQCASPFAAA